jgi:DNA-binding CsgD family transcriptional regulator
MAGAINQGVLFSEPVESLSTIIVNDRCLIQTESNNRIVVVSGIVLAQYGVDDRMAETYAMVSLVEQGWADQKDVARAFGCSVRSVRRHQRRFNAGGLPALGRAGGYPSGRTRVTHSREQLVRRLNGQGLSNREIARRLGVTPKAIRKLLKRIGWHDHEPEQNPLPISMPGGDPNLSAFPSASAAKVPEKALPPGDPNVSVFASLDDESIPVSFDTDPADRRVDRVLACLGLLDDAAPLFCSGARVPHAGVLLALPILVKSGVLTIARKIYGSIGPAFFGLRTTIVALLLMALLRIKRPEALKEHAPDDLGRILGLDRAPEVKTLRRKLSRLAALGRAAEFGRALAERRVAERGAAMGFLYIDGHVRVYHGKRTLPKAHVARMRLAMPATTDYWVNDAAGDPLFVVTAEANAGMTKMLPSILEEVRTLIGERRITIVFDRGGYSPKLFVKLIGDGFDILTYRKGRMRRVARSRFSLHEAVIGGRKVSYTLADQGIRLLRGKLSLRQITRLVEDSHQTPILTSRRDLPAVEVAFRMFERWRQENFFKYLREEYALDALVDYDIVSDNPERDVPNPQRIEMTAKLQQARAEFEQLTAEYGAEAFTNPEQSRPTMRGFKVAQGKLANRIRKAFDRITALEKARAAMPKRVPVGKVVTDVVKLAPERKLLTNILKMVAYQAESDLLHLVAPHYKRTINEGRTLIQSALMAPADLEVTADELHVVLAPQSSPHRTRAIDALCQELNQCPILFPGSHLRLSYAVATGREIPKRTIS